MPPCLVYSMLSERAIEDGERMLDVLQRWGQQRGEVRFLLRHERAPCRETGEDTHKHTIPIPSVH